MAVGTKKEKFHEVVEFHNSLKSETDRGTALVCSAYLDEELKSLLRKSFVEYPKVLDKIFEPSGSLGTFSAKIDMAFVTGLLKPDTHRGLHLIRKMRNDFAHVHGTRSFDDQDIASRCRDLMFLNPFLAEKEPRKLFIRACLSVLAEIHARTFVVKHREIATGTTVESLQMFFEEFRTVFVEVYREIAAGKEKSLKDPKKGAALEVRLVTKALRKLGLANLRGSKKSGRAQAILTVKPFS